MLSTDEDALICDLAEIYGVLDMRSLPVNLVATLSYGLREDSRIKLKMQNQSANFSTMLLATIADRLAILIWQRTKDAEHGYNKPESILDKLLNNEEKEFQSFSSSDEFNAKWIELTNRGDN